MEEKSPMAHGKLNRYLTIYWQAFPPKKYRLAYYAWKGGGAQTFIETAL